MTGAILIIILVLIVGMALFVLVLLSSHVKEHSVSASDEEISVTYFDTTKSGTSPSFEERVSKKPSSTIQTSKLALRTMKSLLALFQKTTRSLKKSIHISKKKTPKSHKESTRKALIEQDKQIQEAVKRQELKKNPVSAPSFSQDIDTSFLEKPKSNQDKEPLKGSAPVAKAPSTTPRSEKGFSALIDDAPEALEPKPEPAPKPVEPVVVQQAPKPIEEKPPVQKEETIPLESPPSSVPSKQPPKDKADSFVQDLLSDQTDSEYMEGVKQPEVETISDSYYYTYMEKRYIDKIMKNPKDISAYKKLGDLYVEMNNLNDAKESYGVVLKLKPQDDLTRKKLREVEQKIQSREA